MKKSMIKAVVTAAMTEPAIIDRLTEVFASDSEAEDKLNALLTGVKIGVSKVDEDALAHAIETEYGYRVIIINKVEIDYSRSWNTRVVAKVIKTRYFKSEEDAQKYVELGYRADVSSSSYKCRDYQYAGSTESEETMWMNDETLKGSVEFVTI